MHEYGVETVEEQTSVLFVRGVFDTGVVRLHHVEIACSPQCLMFHLRAYHAQACHQVLGINNVLSSPC